MAPLDLGEEDLLLDRLEPQGLFLRGLGISFFRGVSFIVRFGVLDLLFLLVSFL